MSPTGSETIVVDASALIRAVVNDEPEATRWLEQVATGKVRALAPDLVYAEVANGLRRYIRGGWLDASSADRRLSIVLDLPLTTIPSRLLARQALALTQSCGVSAYDGHYLALALGSGAQLVTADRRLAGAAEAGGGTATLLPPV